ncbi:MAG: NAD(P)H-dependent oxidoreductase [Bacteroidales bacterium]|nr:NAD(P)H-dependent oxidoreductase [Bacteroidales bacterium]
MNVLIIYCHPSKKSFTHQVFNQLLTGLKTVNHKILVSDLYEMDFQSDMSEEEYVREGLGKVGNAVPTDVFTEQEKIQQSDCIIFVYPVWWSDCPAKLKGWFDRVYSVGYAYGCDDKGIKQLAMKKQKLGMVLCTAGHPNEFLDETGVAESMRNVMIDDRLGTRFENKHMVILGGTLYMDQVKEKHLVKAFEIGKNIASYCNRHHA